MSADLEADIIVVGGGLAGHCAALEAAAAGADVLLLEKQAEVGGSTVLSGGSFAFAGTDLQREAGIADSSELLYDDLRKVGGNRNDPALVRLYADHQLDAYRWLRARGVTFGPIQVSSGQSVPRLHPSDPAAVLRRLNEEAGALPNVRVLCRVRARRLRREHDGGRVSGVECEVEGGHAVAAARRGVVLASGGFSRSAALIETFAPHQDKAKRAGGAGNVGEGLLMAWRLGAGFRDMGYVKGTFGNHPSARPEQHTALLAVYKGAIAVNRFGRRFVDESLSYKTLGDACLVQPGAIAFQVFDQDIMDEAKDGVPIFDFERRRREGLLISAPTLSELAGLIDVPGDTLERTVADYNRYVAEGLDPDFGRSGLSLSYGAMRWITRPPFYAYPSTSTIVATYCGLTVDTRMRVLDVEGQPIEGLHAAGELVGGFHGEAYMTGTSLGKCVICGRIAGREAALSD